MKILSLLLFAALGVAFGARASTSPWPWPWAVNCPLHWNELEGDWTLNANEGTQLTISYSKNDKSGATMLNIERADGYGPHSSGTVRIYKTQHSVTVTMYPDRASVEKYRISIRIGYRYQTEVQDCDPSRVEPVLNIQPMPSQEGAKASYPLERQR